MSQLNKSSVLLPDVGYRFAKILLILSALFLPLIAYVDYQNGYLVPAYVKGAVLFVYVIAYYLGRNDEHQLLLRCLVTASLLVMASVGAAYKLDSFHGLIWGPVLPLLFSYLVGSRRGIIFSLVYFLIYAAAYFSFESLHGKPPVDIEIWSQSVFAYFFVLIATVLFRVEMHKNETLLKNVACYDFLTQVLNRCGFVPRMEDEVARLNRYGGHLSLIVVDIDNFKQVNDRCGHATGDAILVEFSALLERQTRKSDIVARWGGEEFVILAPNTDLQACVDLAEKLRMGVECHHFTSIGRMTASFGVVQYQPSESWEVFLNKGDAFLFQAKRNGKNQVSIKKETNEPLASPAIA